ncbi:hypothetical protein ACETK8_14920 [Brevundimonas staleyi]|uniref:VanZ family protein n=1 Tax=Brevundimonas staleyi TaxID=74326 RepID=A0ABW0FXW9_9CAUL
MTPSRLVAILRVAAVFAAIGLTILFLGPFTYLLDVFHVADKEAHALIFFGATLGLFAIAPTWRRTDLALAALAFGVLIEVAQGMTGRSMSLMDLTGDGVGILAALVPGWVEQLRRHARTSPDVTFAELRTADRRQASSIRPPQETVARPISPDVATARAR